MQRGALTEGSRGSESAETPGYPFVHISSHRDSDARSGGHRVLRPKPHDLKLPDGLNNWAAAWTRDETVIWVAQKGLLRKIDFTDPKNVAETRYEGDKTAAALIPADIHQALTAALAIPEAPKQVYKQPKPPPAAPQPPAATPE